jgi:hypothetical protein
MEIRIAPKFRSLIPDITAEEKAGLEKSLLEEHCRNPWGRCASSGEISGLSILEEVNHSCKS